MDKLKNVLEKIGFLLALFACVLCALKFYQTQQIYYGIWLIVFLLHLINFNVENIITKGNNK